MAVAFKNMKPEVDPITILFLFIALIDSTLNNIIHILNKGLSRVFPSLFFMLHRLFELIALYKNSIQRIIYDLYRSSVNKVVITL